MYVNHNTYEIKIRLEIWIYIATEHTIETYFIRIIEHTFQQKCA